MIFIYRGLLIKSMFLLYLTKQQRTDPNMRVDCPHCQQKAIISSSNALSHSVKDLYCQCTNVQHCGATFVMKLGYSHDLNPPASTTAQIAANYIKSLSMSEKQALLQADMFS